MTRIVRRINFKCCLPLNEYFLMISLQSIRLFQSTCWLHCTYVTKAHTLSGAKFHHFRAIVADDRAMISTIIYYFKSSTNSTG